MLKNAVDKIEEFQKFGSILGLERMKVLMEALGNPQKELKVIHVAGTNGKGSISRYIYSVLEQLGYKCGLYSSPFLEVFNERIEFNGQYITDEELERYTDMVINETKKIVGKGQDSPTEFEIITAIAFLYFKEKKSDFVILEVGLGGTGDSTNIIETPLVSVIGSISYDHMDRLGNTIKEIAGEKAGIIKNSCPVVCSTDNEEALQVIRSVSKLKNAPLTETAGFSYKIKEESLKGYVYSFKGKDFKAEDISISMVGKHQIQNSICAVTAIKLLAEKGIIAFDEEKIRLGLNKAKQIGRFEIFGSYNRGEAGRGLVILDGAHNGDGAAKLKETVKDFASEKKILMVTAMLRDKDVDSILEEFKQITTDFVVTEADNPRRADATYLENKLIDAGCKVISERDYRKAIEVALKVKGSYDIILFAGSLYLIGGVRKELRENFSPIPIEML